jgi:hypothetical protein
VDAQAGLDPCWSQTHYVGFVMTRLNYQLLYIESKLTALVIFNNAVYYHLRTRSKKLKLSKTIW